MISGNARLAEQRDGIDRTLFMLKESAEVFSSELLKRSGAPALVMLASGNTRILRISGPALRRLISESTHFNDCLNQESQILRNFYKLQSCKRFSQLDFWRFRPLLSQGICQKFAADASVFNNNCRGDAMRRPESETNPINHGLFIVIEGRVAARKSSGETVGLSAGDWFARGSVFPGQSSQFDDEHALSEGELFCIAESSYKMIRSLSPELVSQMDMLLHSQAQVESSQPGEKTDLLTRISVTNHSNIESNSSSVKIEDEPIVPKLNRALKKYPLVRQHSELECGITCLHMICLFYGKKVSLTQLRELCDIGRSGSSMLDLAESAEQLGSLSRGVRTTFAGLSKLRLPVILYWKRNHFVVLYEIHPDYALIGDPAEGIVKIDAEKFSKEFSEHALELTPTVEWFAKKIQSVPFLPSVCLVCR